MPKSVQNGFVFMTQIKIHPKLLMVTSASKVLFPAKKKKKKRKKKKKGKLKVTTKGIFFLKRYLIGELVSLKNLHLHRDITRHRHFSHLFQLNKNRNIEPFGMS